MNKTVDILYLAKDRIEFTKQTFSMLLQNTNWDLVNKLVVYDDDSKVRNAKWLRIAVEDSGVRSEFRSTQLGSPVGVMNHYLDRREADLFAKIDNDIVVPPGWLEAMISVIEKEPELCLLGMEAGMSGRPPEDWDGRYGVNHDCSHIGGVGLMRATAFGSRTKRPVPNGRFGFTEWQHHFYPSRAWITPDLKMCLLDQLPFEPWLSIAGGYIDEGVSRRWPKYPSDMFDDYWQWWNPDLRYVPGTGIVHKEEER